MSQQQNRPDLALLEAQYAKWQAGDFDPFQLLERLPEVIDYAQHLQDQLDRITKADGNEDGGICEECGYETYWQDGQPGHCPTCENEDDEDFDDEDDDDQ